MIDTSEYEGHTPGPWCYDMHAEWAEETYYLDEEEQQLWRDRKLKAGKESKEHEPHLSPMIEQYEKDDEGKHRYSTFCVRILRGLLWKSDYSGYRFGDENGFIPEEGGPGINVPTPDEIRANARLIAAAPDLLAEVKRLREENDTLAEAIKEDNEILKKHIETLAEVKRLRQAFCIATAHIGYGNHLGHAELRHALNSVGIDYNSLPWADGEWEEPLPTFGGVAHYD